MYFIQETDKPKILSQLLLIPKLEKDKIILPMFLGTKEKNEQKEIKNREKDLKLENKIKKQEMLIAKKTKKILEKTHCKKIILSKELQEKEIFCNQLYTYGFEINNGRWLFKVLAFDAINYAVKKNKMTAEKIKISILVNEIDDIVLETINQIIKKYKNINIVTNHMEKFKKLEEQILEEYGIMITVNNNKKKSLTKSDIILNIDFPNELINKYRIAEKANIINIRGNVRIKQKRFEGKIYNDYEIKYENLEEFDFDKENIYYKKNIYEAYIYKQQPIENIMNKIRKDKVKIVELN